MTAPRRAPGYVPNPNFTQEDWNAVCDSPELTDEELRRLRPAREVLPPSLFEGLAKRRGRPPTEHRKISVTIRLDPDTLNAFKATGDGWQTRMNDVLSAAARQLPARPAKGR